MCKPLHYDLLCFLVYSKLWAKKQLPTVPSIPFINGQISDRMTNKIISQKRRLEAHSSHWHKAIMKSYQTKKGRPSCPGGLEVSYLDACSFPITFPLVHCSLPMLPLGGSFQSVVFNTSIYQCMSVQNWQRGIFSPCRLHIDCSLFHSSCFNV